MQFHVNSSLSTRFYDHARLGVSPKVQLENAKEYKHVPHTIEKIGNGVLWVLDALPRSVKWVGRQFQDPRFVTVGLTLTALFLATLAFYPATTLSAMSATYCALKALLAKIPLWSVKLSAYLLTCSTITGFGARATGRFANADLMKAFYGLPNSHEGNPANMSIAEIRTALEANRRVEIENKDVANQKVVNL